MFETQAVRESFGACGASTPGSRGTPFAYGGPERRSDQGEMAPWSMAAFDEIDYGILLLDSNDQVVHANYTARCEFDADHPLQLLGSELLARAKGDSAALREALSAARHRGLRKLLTLGDGVNRVTLSVVPLVRSTAGRDRSTTLVLLGKRRVCEVLSVQSFARSNQLTDAETRVLLALHKGMAPNEAAERLGVAISTVRTQIYSIRMKTGAGSIRDLVRQVAVLPPLVGALRGTPLS